VQVLRCFDLDVDVAGNQLALHPAGHVELGLCDVAGMTPVPCRFTKSEYVRYSFRWYLMGLCAGHAGLCLCDVSGMTPVPCRFTKSECMLCCGLVRLGVC
jgi:hypothetical protein